MRTNTALTLYNKYYDPDTNAEVYQRKVVTAVLWENRKAKNVLASGGNLAADQAAIYIPMPKNVDTFLGPKTWLALDDKSGYWTLQKGDLLVKGSVSDALSSAFTPSELKAKYDDVLEATTIDTFDMGSLNLRHWKVGAK